LTAKQTRQWIEDAFDLDQVVAKGTDQSLVFGEMFDELVVTAWVYLLSCVVSMGQFIGL